MSNVTPLFPDRPAALDGFPAIAIANPQLEQSLLGILLIRPERQDELPAGFDVAFYDDPLHSDIHRAIVAVGRAGVPATLQVIEALGITDADRREYVQSLITAPVATMPGMARGYADSLVQNYRRRQLLAVANEMREAAYGAASDDAAGIGIAVAMGRLEQLTNGVGQSGRHAVSLNDAMDAAMRQADEAAHRGGPAGLLTGFPSLDMRMGGMEPGDMIVLGGRPGSGKTGLALQALINVARSGVGVCLISQEMMATALGRRALACIAGVPVAALKQGRHGPYADRLREARRELKDLPLSIEDVGGLRLSMIGLKARAARRRHGLGLLAVDHMHITPPEAGEARHGPTHAIGETSQGLKRLAKAEQIPVLALAQLNRGPENREDHRPTLGDLRQAGGIEQDADAVLFLYRQEMYMLHEPEQAPGENQQRFNQRADEWRAARNAARGRADVICAKVRDGDPGTVPMLFDGPTTSFSELGA